jgi:hypothetical protein
MQDKAGYVYLMRDNKGRYKIGRSKDPVARAKYICYTSKPVELIWYLRCEDSKTTERALHQRCQRYHYDHEWFDLPSDVVEWVRQQDESVLCSGYNPMGYVRPDNPWFGEVAEWLRRRG